jgi:hypothetical protein
MLPIESSDQKVRTYEEYHSVCPSSELGLPPTPHPLASVPPPTCFWGEGNTRWERPNSDSCWLFVVLSPDKTWSAKSPRNLFGYCSVTGRGIS